MTTTVQTQPTKLVREALAPFRAMLWAGLVLAALGLISMVIGFGSGGAAVDPMGPFALGGGCFALAATPLVGAAIVAALGKREPVKASN